MDIGTLTGHINLEDNLSPSLSLASRNLKSFGSSLTSAGTSLSLGLTAPLVAAGAASLTLSGNFEMITAKLVSLAGVSSGELEGVRAKLLELAPAVGIGPQALAVAMTKVSSTMENTALAMEVLDVAAHGSAAGMGEAVDVAGALTAVIKSYGESQMSAAKAGDILTKTIQLGGAEAKELAPTLANVVPFAAQLGISFEEVGANIATVTQLGVPAAEAVTQLSSVMTALVKETKQGTDALEAQGLSYAGLRAEVREKGLAATLLHLTEVFRGNETGLTDVFGRIEAVRDIMSVGGAQAGEYQRILEELKGSIGSLDKAFEVVTKTQVHTWNELIAVIQVAAIKFGNALAPAFKSALDAALPLMDVVVKMAEWFGKLPQPIQTVAIGATALVAAIGPLLFMVGGIATGIAALTPLLVPLGGLFAAAVSPIGLVVLAVAGLAAAIYKFRGEVSALEGKPLSKSFSASAKSAEEMTAKAKELAASAPPLVAGLTTVTVNTDKLTQNTDKAAKVVPKLTEAQEKARDAAIEAARAYRDLNNWIGERFIDSVSKLNEQIRGLEDATVGLVDTGLLPVDNATVKAVESMLALDDKVRELDNSLAVLDMEEQAKQFMFVGPVLESLDLKTTTWKDTLESLSGQMVQMAQVAGDSFGGIVQDVAEIVVAWNAAVQAAEAYTNATTRSGKAVAVAGMASSFLSATKPGQGKAKGALSGAMSGAAIGTAILPGWGTAIGFVAGGIVGLVRNWGGVTKEIKAAREELTKFEDMLHATLTLADLQESGGERWKMTVIAVREAYERVGKSAEDAMAITTQLWNTDDPRAMAAAMEEVNRVMGLQQASQDALNDAIGRYKFTIEELGPALAAQKLSEQGQQLYSDWQLLIEAGVDVSAVGREMQESINAFLQDAIRTGTEVDVAMKPMIQRMIDMGLLTDSAGNKITSLEGSGITFSMTMSEGFKSIVDSVKELTDALRTGLGLAIDSTTKKINAIPRKVTVDIKYNDDRGILGRHFSGGGMVYAAGGFEARGTDTVPAMLTPGERVLTVSQTDAYNKGEHGEGGNHTLFAIQSMAEEIAMLRRDFQYKIPKAMVTQQHKVGA